MNSEDRPPKWAYLVSLLLVVMTGLLGVAIVFVVFTFLGVLPQELDIQMTLSFIILPLSILIFVTTIALAILLTKGRN
ncbi:MAG: hypothetical protein ACFE7R_06215 [Candidatus Hodarchaeota archaeon]